MYASEGGNVPKVRPHPKYMIVAAVSSTGSSRTARRGRGGWRRGARDLVKWGGNTSERTNQNIRPAVSVGSV